MGLLLDRLVSGSSRDAGPSRRSPVRGRRLDLAMIARFASTKAPRSIAVIGAGLSGLSHALFLARGLKADGEGRRHRIVLYESSDRTGGWVDSQRIDVGDGSTALVEKGPRSIRAVPSANAYAMLELIGSLGLAPKLINVSKEHPSAKNRMVLYDNQLQLMPNDFRTLALAVTKKGHILHGAVSFGDLFHFLRTLRTETQEQRRRRQAEWHDESVEDFIGRVLNRTEGDERGTTLVDKTVSAFLHGVYAADASQLSIRATTPFIINFFSSLSMNKSSWWPPWPFNVQMHTLAEAVARGDEFPWAKRALRKHERELKEKRASRRKLGSAVVAAFKETSVLSFQDGVQTLTDAIRDECVKAGVEIRLGTPVTGIELGDDSRAAVTSAKGTEQFERVIAALSSSKLAKTLKGVKLPALDANPSTTVCVVNVVVPKHFGVRLVEAFGFLVPRIVTKQGQNPHGLLGVVFDSVAVPGQDEHTKLTMMFGGPYWRKGYVMHDIVTQKTDGKARAEEEAMRLLDLLLFRSENPTPFSFTNEAVIANLHVQRNCIPTYAPGHVHRMYELHEALDTPQARALSVIGASYTGVSVNDCVLYARRTADRIVEAEQGGGLSSNVTGLEEYVGQ